MEIVNLNQVRKIVFSPRKVTDLYKWAEIKHTTFKQWFLNLFKSKDNKEYTKERFIIEALCYSDNTYDTAEDFNSQNGEEFYAEPNSKLIFRKAFVSIVYASKDIHSEYFYFDSNKQAKEYFDKINKYAQEHNVPFINFEAETLKENY